MTLRHDFIYAARVLRSAPVFTATAMLSLAIGIAGNAAIFSLADALLLRAPRAVADPDRLVDVGRSQDGRGFDNFSYANYIDFRDRNTVFSGLAGARFGPEPVGLGIGDGAERVWASAVSGNYFDVLGTSFALGRGFRPEEDRINGDNAVAVISHSLWRHRFGGATDILGRTIRVNGRPISVVGVTVEGFSGTTLLGSDIWLPLTAMPMLTGQDSGVLRERASVSMMGIARLRRDVTLAQARAEMDAIARALEREHPIENRGKGAVVASSARIPGGNEMRTIAVAFVGLLFALVGLVLLIACTNLAGMLLARGVARAREVAVRLAVGATRRRIVQQLLTESILLSLCGAASGVVAAVWTIRALRAFVPALPLPIAVEPALDWRVVGFSVALALVSGVLFGLVPAWASARTDLVCTLKVDVSGRGAGRSRVRQAFVVAQVAMSVLLLVCALLFARSLANAGTIDPGFTADGLDVIALDFRLAGYDKASGIQFSTQVLDRVQQIPGVHSAAYARILPLTGSGLGLGRLSRPGDPRDDRGLDADWNVITPDYFKTMHSALVAGRTFTAADRDAAPSVAIVNETLARRAWPGQSAIGQILVQDGDREQPPRELQVVGVAKDGKYRSLGEAPRSFIYVPMAQQYLADVHLLVRSANGHAVPAVRTLLRQMDSNLPIVMAMPMAEAAAIGLLPQRVAAWVAGAFGFVGVLLAAIGIYGITAYSVTQRTREIGVRVALGAARGDVFRLVIGQAMRMSAMGAVVGLLMAAGAAQLLVSLLYGIRPIDSVSFAAGTLFFGALALVASWLPARRAAALNPVEALRTE